ncbi:MAG: tetratricopeptide repeat protein [Chloroflexota bacterium]
MAPPINIHIRLLGSFSVSRGTEVIPNDSWRLNKSAALIKLLALAPGHRMHAEQITEVLWPDLAPPQARNNLHHVLHVSRRILDPDSRGELLSLKSGIVNLSPYDVWTDVIAFEQAAVAARGRADVSSYRLALAMYQGPLDPTDLYEDWIADRRTHLQNLFLDLSLEGGKLFQQKGEVILAVETLQRAIAAEPALEAAHVGLMRLHAGVGQRQLALRQFDQLRDALERELGIQPEPESLALAEEIRAGRLPADIVAVPANPPEDGKHNLPRPLTSFTSREGEMAEVRRLVMANRLVTLTGPGGVGKTRLAIEVGADVAGLYPDGVWMLPVAPVSSAAGISLSLAALLKVPESEGSTVQQALAQSLRHRTCLIILDNCEHLIEACESLCQYLLTSCPRIHIMCTSRETLSIAGEVVFTVPPLALPAEDGHPDVAKLLDRGAVSLFVDRARYRRPDFVLDASNAVAVVQICRQLDGLPLAIELAAARVSVMSPAQIAERLGSSLALLAGGGRTSEPRHRTVRAALDWSYQLLDAEEQELFARLAVFVSGWSLEAVEAVGVQADVSDVLSRLVDKSLVVAQPAAGSVRFRLLEPIRRYAQERLDESGKRTEAELHHIEFYLSLAERAEPELVGTNQVEWVDRLAQEHSNFRAALRRSIRGGLTEHEARLAGALWRFWFTRGYLSEGLYWLDDALERSADSKSAGRAKVLFGAGVLASYRGDHQRSRRIFEESLALAELRGNKSDMAGAFNSLGNVAYDLRDYDRAAGLFSQSLLIRRELGESHGIGAALNNLGNVALSRGEPDRAAAYFEESLAIWRDRNDPMDTALSLGNLGTAERNRGRFNEAVPLFLESLDILESMGNEVAVIDCIEELAGILSASGSPARAVLLLAATAAARDRYGAPLSPNDLETRKSNLDSARRELGAGAFEAAWADGNAMTIQQAAASARENNAQSKEARSDVLTKRERDIAALVAEGLTNRQIAVQLQIAERTADTHVSKILRKLGFSSRSQLAVWMATAS